MNKVAIFVDVQNIYYTTKEVYGRQFDYRTFWKNISNKSDIVTANAYAIERNNDGQKRFQRALKSIGFTVILKPFIQRSDGTAKGDWDVGITLDVFEMAAGVDEVILLSGDGDFSLLLDKIRGKYNVKTHVYGVTELTAKALIDSSTHFTAINKSLLL